MKLLDWKPTRFPSVPRVRFAPRWNPDVSIPATGLIHCVYRVGQLIGDNLHVVEIGSNQGESASIIAAFPFVEHVACIDKWSGEWGEEQMRAFKVRTRQFYSRGRVSMHRYTSSDAVRRIDEIAPNGVDFLYIDGGHGYTRVKDDIEKWRGTLTERGIMGGHDYRAKLWPGVTQAVDEEIELTGKRIETFHDSSWILIP